MYRLPHTRTSIEHCPGSGSPGSCAVAHRAYASASLLHAAGEAMLAAISSKPARTAPFDAAAAAIHLRPREHDAADAAVATIATPRNNNKKLSHTM